MIQLHGTCGDEDDNDSKTHELHETLSMYVFSICDPHSGHIDSGPKCLCPTKPIADQQVFFAPVSHSYRKCVLVAGTFYLLSPFVNLTMRGDRKERERQDIRTWLVKQGSRIQVASHFYHLLSVCYRTICYLSLPPAFLLSFLS